MIGKIQTMRLMQNLIPKLFIIEKVQQYDIWLADLNPAKGSIPGKIRPVVIIQSNILNKYSMSTVICPITTNVLINHALLRVLIPKGQLDLDSDILIDQIRTIENKKLIKKISRLNYEQIKKIKKGLMIVLDL